MAIPEHEDLHFFEAFEVGFDFGSEGPDIDP